MEGAVQAGSVRQLGISRSALPFKENLNQLRRIYKDATLKPAILQQRFYAESGLGRELHAWCHEKGIYLQCPRCLTMNRHPIDSEAMQGLAVKYNVTPPVLFFRFLMSLDVVPLTGTTSDEHMTEDLSAWRVPLTAEDSDTIGEMLMLEGLGLF